MGVKTHPGKSQTSVAWAARTKETDSVKPADKACCTACRQVSEESGRNMMNADVASKAYNTGGREILYSAKAKRADTRWLTCPTAPAGCKATARFHRAHLETVKPSSPRERNLRVQGWPHNRSTRERVQSREGGGRVRVAVKAANTAGAKGPCWFGIPSSTRGGRSE
jgi:hypothetical protein